jgi:hypothetical protein
MTTRPLLLGLVFSVAAVAPVVSPSLAASASITASRVDETGARSGPFTQFAHELTPRGLTVEAAAVQVPTHRHDLRAPVPASLAVRARLPVGAGLALRLRPGGGGLAPLVGLELARAPVERAPDR